MTSSFAEFVRLPSDISFAEKFKCAHRVVVKFAHLLWYVRTKENVDKGSGAMSDAPATNDAAPMDDAAPMTQEEAEEDLLMDNLVIYEARKSAIKEGKSNRRQTRNPGQYKVSDAAKACIKSFLSYVRNQENAPAKSTIKAYERIILSYFGWYENAANASGKSNVDDEERKRLVSQVAWADDKDGNAADMKELLEPIVVISPKLYDGFLADRTKSFGDATWNATKNTCNLRSAALGYFVDYLFDEEEALKQKYEENDRIKTFLGNKDAWKRVRDLERKERGRNRGGYFVSSKFRSQLMAKRKRDEDEGWSKGELDCTHRSIANTVMNDHDMFNIGQAAILHLLVAKSLETLANASYTLYAFISARWLQRVSDILAVKFTAFEVVHADKRDPPGMLPLERQVPVLYVQLMDYKGVGLKAPSSGQSLTKLQRASSIRHFRAEMCPHTTLSFEVQI